MIVGVGIDLIGVERIAAVYSRQGERFLARVFSQSERAYCLERSDPSQALAARWAAKEACMKALGTGWAHGVTFLDIVVLAAGSAVGPRLQMSGAALARAQLLGAAHWHCSLSHSDGFAIAMVVLESGHAGALP